MQTLQTNRKIALSLGVIATIVVSGAMMSLSTFNGVPEHESVITPTNGMPVPGTTAPEMIVSNEDSSTTNGMPVPGNNVPEMIVNHN